MHAISARPPRTLAQGADESPVGYLMTDVGFRERFMRIKQRLKAFLPEIGAIIDLAEAADDASIVAIFDRCSGVYMLLLINLLQEHLTDALTLSGRVVKSSSKNFFAILHGEEDTKTFSHDCYSKVTVSGVEIPRVFAFKKLGILFTV